MSCSAVSRRSGRGRGVNVARGTETSPDSDRPALVQPAVPAAVQDAHPVVSVIAQRPPEPGRVLAPGVIDGDHMSRIADAPLGHRLGEPPRRRDLDRHRVVRIDNVAGPVDVDRARDMPGEVLLAGSPVLGLVDARADRPGHHVSPHIHDPDVRVVQVFRQPIGRDEHVF